MADLAKITNRMPLVVAVKESRRDMCYAAATVEGKVEFSVLEIESNEVDMENVGHVEHDCIRGDCPQLYTELSPTRHHVTDITRHVTAIDRSL